jgi:hypothetical protein
MWTVVKVQDTEVLRDVMDRWKSGIDGGNPSASPMCSPRTPFSRGCARIALGDKA